MKIRFFLPFVITGLLLLSVQTSISVPKKSSESEPSFSDITVTSSTSHLLLFAMLDNAFTDEMEQGLHSGLPVHFSFFVELAPTEGSWKDNRLVSLDINHVISYDTLKEMYRVEIEESGKRFYSYPTLDEAKRAAREINGLRVIELAELQPDVSYTIRIRAELYKKTLPMELHKVLPFVSWWDINTRWHSISFSM